MNKSTELLPLILVLGATGHVGRETIIALTKDCKCREYAIRAGVLDVNSEGGMMDAFGIQAVQCDLSNLQSVEAACNGVQKLFLILANVPERVQHCKNVVEAAKKNNIQQFVFLSVIDAPNKEGNFGKQYKECEDLINKSGINYVHLRSMFFQENFIGLGPSICEDNKLKLSVGNGKFSPVSMADVGEVATNLLLDPHNKYKNQYFDLTGPELVSGQDVANILTKVMGTEVGFQPISEQEMANVFVTLGYSKFEAEGLAELFNSFSKNEKDFLSHDVETLLGRKATPLEFTLNNHKSHFSGRIMNSVTSV